MKNKKVKSLLEEILNMVDDKNSMQILGLMMLAPISRRLKQMISEIEVKDD